MTKSTKSLNFLTSFYYLLPVRFSKFQKLLLRRQTVGNFTKSLTDRYIKFVNENETLIQSRISTKISSTDSKNSSKEEAKAHWFPKFT